MRLMRVIVAGMVVCLVLPGCGGSSMVKTKGRIMKGGVPFKLGEGEGLRIIFVPVDVTGTTSDSYAAQFLNDDGKFEVLGKDGRGLPPGSYRVGLQLLKNKEDLFNGNLMAHKSPFTCEVNSSSDEVVLDLDQCPNLGKAGKGTVQ